MTHIFIVGIRRFFIALFGVIFALVTACSYQDYNVVKDYMDAVADNRVEEAIGYSSFEDAKDNDFAELKEKFLVHINHLNYIIQENGGLSSLSITFDNDSERIRYAKVKMSFKNEKTEEARLTLVNESGNWKIKASKTEAEIEIENYVQTIANNQIEEAYAFFPIDNTKERMYSNFSGRIMEKHFPLPHKNSPPESEKSPREVLSGIIAESNDVAYVYALARACIENLAASIHENGGLDSISTTADGNGYGDKINVEAYVKYKNNKLEKRIFQLLNVYRWKWKIVSDKALEEQTITIPQIMTIDLN